MPPTLSEALTEHAQDKPIQSWTKPQTEQDKWDDRAQDLLLAAARRLAPFEQREVPVPSDGILTRFDFTQVTEADDMAYWQVEMDEPQGRETETAWVARRETSGGVIITRQGPTPQDAICAAQEADHA